MLKIELLEMIFADPGASLSLTRVYADLPRASGCHFRLSWCLWSEMLKIDLLKVSLILAPVVENTEIRTSAGHFR